MITTRPGDCYDNAPKESFWAILKKELMSDRDFATHQEARAVIFEYIEVFYNRQRIHGSIGYLSPEQFEAGRR
ncbi:MAG: IS3 family transposase [Phycisphaeraceae bacterium]|nr:IS3 family transposase [Phycisphaeraceae bacterium]MBX3407632.1 IS3 family transposase [Phycisphaeraceae bacterium]